MSRSRDHRYYDDSDDMVERIRRVREAFEKRTRAFQGPDWPYYEKRAVVGQKKKEDMDPSIFQDDSTAAPEHTAANLVAAETGPAAASDPAQPNDTSTAAEGAAWWEAHRKTKKASEPTADSPLATDGDQDSEDGNTP
jgi:hypothetical protein